MTLSDVLLCICFPCYPKKIVLYDSVFNETRIFTVIQNDDCWTICKSILDNEVIEIDFQYDIILVSDKKVHT